jgi:hypothetical protein
MGTPFTQVYNRFLGKITDDMYMELTPEDTVRDLRNLLIDAIPGFEFPRIDLTAYSIDLTSENVLEDTSSFDAQLSSEEENILAILMMINWVQRQVTSIENTRMKFSGSDFKFTSQANHLSKLLNLLGETQRQSHHMQRLYKRRRTNDEGRFESNWSILRDTSALD